jgi:hypothetical protein
LTISCAGGSRLVLIDGSDEVLRGEMLALYTLLRIVAVLAWLILAEDKTGRKILAMVLRLSARAIIRSGDIR